MRRIQENLKHQPLLFGTYKVRCPHCGALDAISFSRSNEAIICDNCGAIVGYYELKEGDMIDEKKGAIDDSKRYKRVDICEKCKTPMKLIKDSSHLVTYECPKCGRIQEIIPSDV